MARARNIKPALFKNEVLGQADLALTILFAGLWTLADREGRLEDRPLRIKAEIFPYREGLDINGYLTELASLGFIDRYVVNGISIIQVLTFSEHQNPHKTEKASTLPEKPIPAPFQEIHVKAPLNNGELTEAAVLIPDSLNTDSLVLIPDSLNTDSRLKPKPKAVASVCLPDWMPAELWKAYVASRRSMKKHPMTSDALDLVIVAIAKCREAGYQVDEIMTALIENGWRTVKPDWLAKRHSAPDDESLEERAQRLSREMFGNSGQVHNEKLKALP